MLSTFPARGATWIGAPGLLAPLQARAEGHARAAHWRADNELHLPDEAALDPTEALASLERALTDRGGAVRRGVTAIKASENEIALADGTRERADLVVLATGLGAPDLAPHAPPPLTPTKGQILEVRSSALAAGAALRGADVYAVGRTTNRVVLGATMEPGRADLGTDPETLDLISARAGRLSPMLQGAPRLRGWAGVRPMSPDWAPRIGRAGGLIVARGHSRNGWLLAPISAEIVCAHAFGDNIATLWAAFAP
jgi:glycine/D-amino acid oxidase-like deaminating enzyme